MQVELMLVFGKVALVCGIGGTVLWFIGEYFFPAFNQTNKGCNCYSCKQRRK